MRPSASNRIENGDELANPELLAICSVGAAVLRSVALPVFPRHVADASDFAELVEAACAGSADAFREIHVRFARVVHGILLSRVGPADADDLTQEVFLTLHEKLPRLRDGHALPAWICTVARNAAADWIRRKRRRPVLEVIDDSHVAPDIDREAELREHVLAVVRGLPEAYSETLVLRLVEGMTGPEIAAETGLTPGSVRVNLCRGMALLRERLGDGWRA